jgi:hypothetical protein
LSKVIRYSIPLIIVAAVFCTMSLAQDFRATITGRVLDASGAAIPGAEVQVTNVGTNETTKTITDDGGNYKVPFLKPGIYTLSVELSGFKKYVREGIELGISQVATIDATLEIGEISQSVTVTGAAPLIESANADRGGVIDNQRVREFPLNARNPFMLGILTPGVLFNGAAIWQRPFDNGAIAEWTINGSQSRGNEFLLDGAPNNGQAGGNNIAYVPPVDSVEEFKIMTNTYDAQYGKTTGGIINVSLRSGTNKFHGTAYEFARRNPWDANDFRNKARGRSSDGTELFPRAGHYLDQYGWQFEGPVYLPKLYNGKDRTFFMFNYEGYREGVPSPLTISVPEPEMLQGDFSKLVDAAGRPIVIYDPATGRADSSGNWIRTPFPGNIIPKDRLNPISQKILSFMPKPNTRTGGQAYSQSNLFISPNIAGDSFYNWVLKIDQNLNERHRFFGRFAHNSRTEDRADNGVIEGPGQTGQQPFQRINYTQVFDYVGTMSPTFILNGRVSWNRFEEDGFGRGNVGFDKTTLGFPASLISQIPHGAWFGRYEFSNYMTLGRHRSRNITNTWAFHPNLTKIWNAHSLKGGIDMRWTQYIQNNMGNPFRLTANRAFTQRVFNQGDALSGDSIATFLLGIPTGGGIDYNLFPTNMFPYYAPWFQDDWKVNPRLTLNLGIRWDVNISPDERYNRLNRGFDPTVVSPVDKLIDRTKFPDLPQLKGGLRFAGVNGVPKRASDIDWNNFQPRLGFAYLVNKKLVMRGGWGIYYVNPNNDYIRFNGFQLTTDFIGSLDDNRTPRDKFTINDPFPNGVQVPPGSSLGLATFLGRGFQFVGDNFVVPYVHQFSFGFQYQMPWESKLEISYVGNRTRRLQTERAFNEPSLAFRQKCNPMEGGSPGFCDQLLPNPFFGLEEFRGTTFFGARTVSRFDLARPYPHFGGLTEQARNDGNIWYDSAQATFEKRTKHGLNIVSTYTFSKQIEEWGWNDVQKGVKQRGLYVWERPHRFTVGSVYQLPFGAGQRWLNTSHGLWSRVFSGWENTIILQWQAGRPWEGPGGNAIAVRKEAYLDRSQIDWHAPQVWGVRNYPDQDPKKPNAACVAIMNNDGSITLQPYSATLVGCTKDNYDFLRLPRYAPRLSSFRESKLRGHSVPIWDVSINKMTNITETTKIQFRVEAFNVTNTYQYDRVYFNRDINNGNFGSMFPWQAGNTDVSYPRNIQLAVKFIW